jgi:hypothetical protein
MANGPACREAIAGGTSLQIDGLIVLEAVEVIRFAGRDRSSR